MEGQSRRNHEIAALLSALDLGTSIAEQDELLEHARVDTSVLTDMLQDRVDLVPGTKGSGKSALYRVFVDFLPGVLLEQRKIVIAHGVESHGDQVFHAFKDRFEKLTEDQFVDFWCIYLVSLAHEHFLKSARFASYLNDCRERVERFRRACAAARIPEIKARKTLRDVLEWALDALPSIRPKITFKPEDSAWGLELFDKPEPERVGMPSSRHDTSSQTSEAGHGAAALPKYVGAIKEELEGILAKADLSLWLMIDRLDEIFPRRSEMETRALRGLLRTLQVFASPRLRVKVFLRDDILEQVARGPAGFPSLSHITARQADTLQWSERQILTLIVKRIFATEEMRTAYSVDVERLAISQEYQEECFYRVFPTTLHKGARQSRTLRWIYNHTMDGRGTVTPRDVIELLTKAKQKQEDLCNAEPDRPEGNLFGTTALLYGHEQLSVRKRDTVLKAEYPHLWPHIEKLVGGRSECTDKALRARLGKQHDSILQDLVGVGVLEPVRRGAERRYRIPYMYRHGLAVTQGTDDSGPSSGPTRRST